MILAGGRSSRMGGGDKCLRTLGGLSILGHLIERIQPQSRRIYLNINGDPNRFAHFGLPVIPDDNDQNWGPLAGINAALAFLNKQSDSQTAMFVPADSPFLPKDLLSKLSAAMGNQQLDVCYAEHKGQRHYTTGLWGLNMGDSLASYLDEGNRAVHKFLSQRNAASVVFESTSAYDPFYNINSPSDLVEAEGILEKITSR